MNKALKIIIVMAVVILASSLIVADEAHAPQPVDKPAGDILLGAPTPSDSAEIHWYRPFTPDDIRLRVAVTATSEDTVSKLWLDQTDQIFRSWEVYGDMFSFSRFYTYSTGEPDVTVAIANYGATGWISQSSVVRNSVWHIQSATVKLNAYYLATDWDTYVDTAESIYCHEFGHILGLKDQRTGILDGVQDNTCMHEQGLFNGTAEDIPNTLDSDALIALYSHAEPALPDPDANFEEIVDTTYAP